MHYASTSRWALTLDYQDLASLLAHGPYFENFGELALVDPYFENFGELALVDVRVILFVEDDKIDEYLYPHIELGTLRVYMCMYMMGVDATCISK